MAAQDLAAMLGIRPEHLSRVENRLTATFGRPADRLTRTISMLMLGDTEAARQVLLKAATLVSPIGQAARLFTLVAGRRWKRAA